MVLNMQIKLLKMRLEIDWNLPSINIFNKIRAFDPFPSTYTFLSGVKIKIVSQPFEKNII